MSMERIRAQYGVPAKRGMVIRFRGEPVTITSASPSAAHLYARDAYGGRLILHPTWEIEYPEPQEAP